MAICPNCLGEMPDGQTLCANCAAGAAPAPAPQQPEVQPAAAAVAVEAPVAEAYAASAAPAAPQFYPQYTAPQPVAQPVMPTFHVPLTKEQLPAEFKPLGAWAYFGYSLLFSIPLVGFILLLVFALGGTQNVNLRSFARSHFCAMLVAVLLVAVLVGVALGLGVSLTSMYYHW